MYAKSNQETERPELRQMNLRVREDVREGFKQFCAEHGTTQSEGLRLLLAQSDSDVSNEMLRSMEMDLCSERIKNRELQATIEQIRHNHESANKRCIEYSSVVRGVFQYILDNAAERKLKHPLVKVGRFKQWPAKREYRTHPYPKASGCCLFTLESMMYASCLNAPLFLIGSTNNGEPIKFRQYPKKERIGIDPRSKTFGYKGSEWLIGYIIAKDGAADVYVSIPLDALYKKDSAVSETESSSSLDTMIAAAKSKSTTKWI